MSSKLDKPYRQRVYRVTDNQNQRFESAIFTLTDPLRFANHPEAVERLNPDSLKLKDGCSVILQWVKKERYYLGSTEKDKCPSDMRGASYATSEVKLQADKLVSWDRGYDRDGKQVWGAEKGGYLFVKSR